MLALRWFIRSPLIPLHPGKTQLPPFLWFSSGFILELVNKGAVASVPTGSMGVLNSQGTDISYLLLLCWCLIAEVLISDRLRFRSCDLFVFWPEDPRLFVIWVISLWGPLWARNPPPGGGDSSAGTCSWKSCAPGGKNGSLQRWWPGRERRRAAE